MITKSKVSIKYKTKPIFLEVESGYSTLGSFTLVIFKGGGQEELFPDRVKKLNDDIIDTFLLPFSPEELLDIKLYIFGKYGPAPLHKQISVKYNFVQQTTELEVIKKGSNEILEELDGFSKRFYNEFQFNL